MNNMFQSGCLFGTSVPTFFNNSSIGQLQSELTLAGPPFNALPKPEETFHISINKSFSSSNSNFDVLGYSVKKLEITGDPIEITLECDYKTINVKGRCHRLYVIGICNTVNFTGNLHSVRFHGFNNYVSFNADEINGKCAVWEECLLDGLESTTRFGNTNGTFVQKRGPKPEKLPFPTGMKEGRRRRFIWKSAKLFDSESFESQYESDLELEVDETEEIDWEDSSERMDNQV